MFHDVARPTGTRPAAARPAGARTAAGRIGLLMYVVRVVCMLVISKLSADNILLIITLSKYVSGGSGSYR